MMFLKVILLCVSAALICSMLRGPRPEIAAAISMAVGAAALLLTGEEFRGVLPTFSRFFESADLKSGRLDVVLKAAGIAVLSELGVQICCDAGETALGGRIRLACKVLMLGLAMPLILEIVQCIDALLSF